MSLLVAPSVSAPAQLENLKQIQIGKYFFLGAYTMLLYDHILTLPEEVQTVWKKKKTFPLYLFVVVRYYAPLAVTVVAFGFFSTTMTRSRCAHWMLFLPLGITMPLTLFPGILMLIRVYALYNRNRVILYGLSASLLLQTVAGLWQYTVSGGVPAPLPLDNYEYHFCIYLPPRRIGHLSTMYVFWELGYDSIIFLLTVARTFYVHWRHQGVTSTGAKHGLIGNLVRDGAFYFGCIFSMNLMWVIMIMHAPTGLRAIASIPSSCVNTVMVCRITLNLRTTVYGPTTFERTHNSFPMGDVRSPLSRRSQYAFSPTATNNLQVHIRTDYDQLQDHNRSIIFTDRNNVEDRSYVGKITSFGSSS
ncbi:hypothetical protein B0F90DRAFT_1703754 [Multifurca ochricompacta]|uniref:DUF6533 domain-containing protein n=1 Tax=Multifurca ochricompacta TaxID=376703 RepID=A0AAD4QP82_9AGAM|nr:hypothetical protein B0F90DRAFT_1703754 [Multifurca ochricompacta]